MVGGAVRVRVPGAILQRERRGKLEGDRGEREEGQGNVVFLTRRRARRGGPGRRGGSAVPAGRGADKRRDFSRKPPGPLFLLHFLPLLPLFLEVLPHLTKSI